MLKTINKFALVIVITAVIAGATTYVLKPSKSNIVEQRVVLSNEITGGFVPMTGVTVGAGIYKDLPTTASKAITEGWIDSVLCASGKGRYFYKQSTLEPVPYLLMYDIRDELIGVYFYSIYEMPKPWTLKEKLKPFSETILDFEHSNLILFFKDPVNACRRDDKNSDGSFN